MSRNRVSKTLLAWLVRKVLIELVIELEEYYLDLEHYLDLTLIKAMVIRRRLITLNLTEFILVVAQAFLF